MSTTFQYRVRDPLGHEHEGQLDSSNEVEAAQQLRRDGFQVLALEEEADSGLFPRRVKRSDIVYFTNQLAVMVDTGIPLATALEGIIDQEENLTFKAILVELKAGVEEGEDFSTMLARFPRHFDKTYVALVRVGEATGSLGAMLERVATSLRKELETRGKVKAAMAYPMVMFTLAICVTVFLLTFIMPKFTPLFERRGMKLPLPTRLALAISHSMLDYWWVWLGGLVLLIAGFIVSRRHQAGQQAWDWLKINAPLVGPTARKVTISRSIRTLGTMLSSGIPMLDALRLTGEVSGNFYYQRLWNNVVEQISGGKQVHEALRGSPLVPRMLVQMVSAGEQSGQLGPVLERVSNFYDQEVESAIKGVTSTIEPIMITVMGGVVGTIGLALLLPIFSLSSARG